MALPHKYIGERMTDYTCSECGEMHSYDDKDKEEFYEGCRNCGIYCKQLKVVRVD